MSDQEAAVANARRWVDEASRVVVLTGAGISTDSGIPDFRGPQGVWTKDPEAEKMATIQHYLAEPDVRKRSWQAKLAALAHQRDPNAGHRALLALERRRKLHTLITQNVDGLHHAAGSDPDRVIEIHGTVREYACMSCDDRGPIDVALDRVRAGEEDPSCAECGGILKSATISFGQGLVSADLARSERAANECDLMLAIGTTLGVYPIANVVPVAKQCGAKVVILNGEATEMDFLADALLRGSISELLPEILAEPAS